MAVAITSSPALGLNRNSFATVPASQGGLRAVEAPIRRTFRKRELIYGRGDAADCLFVLESGRVKLYRLTPDGREVAVGIVEPGEPFGEEPAVGAEVRELYAEALAPTRVRIIGKTQLREWVRDRPDVLIEITRSLWLRLGDVERQIENLVFRKVTHRLAGLLVQWAEKYGEPTKQGLRLRIRLTHQEMASLIGSSRETVTLTLGQLLDDGLIGYDAIDRRSIVVPDLDRLVAYANQ